MKGLKAIRQKLALSQADLEKLTGIDANTFSRYERGVVKPSIEVAQKIADALNVSVDELLNGSAKQEFEVKIVMGVKNLTGLAGIEVMDNTFLYGVQDDEPQIHLAGKVRIDTPELRAKARDLILKKFDAACRMFDLKDKIEAEV
ncbi:MAG: helix-turn-helix transcriptional regulator [Synergistaceae bacterium]|nr:helix-turn-helix transcriptional regulator [Synergistaceae bacterium]